MISHKIVSAEEAVAIVQAGDGLAPLEAATIPECPPVHQDDSPARTVPCWAMMETQRRVESSEAQAISPSPLAP